MIRYKMDVLEALKDSGYNTNHIRKHKLLNESALQYLREGKPVGIKAIDKLCSLLHCQPGDLMEWVPDDEAAAK